MSFHVPKAKPQVIPELPVALDVLLKCWAGLTSVQFSFPL